MAIIMKSSDLEEEAPPEVELLFAIICFSPLGVKPRHTHDRDTGDTKSEPMKLSRASRVT
jgi:hypothetical protein